MENNEIIKSAFKGKKILLIVSIIALVIAILLFLWINEIVNKEVGEPQYLNDVIDNSGEKENIYSKVDVQMLTDEFATYGEGDITDEKYYFAFDGEYYYILNLTTSTFYSLKEINDYTYSTDENAIMPDPISVTGMTKKIPEELKQIAIESFNSIIGEEVVNEDNFEDYYGDIYLIEGMTPQDNIDIQVFALCMALATFIVCFVCYLYKNNKIKRTIKFYKQNEEYDLIEKELENSEVQEFKKAKTILTRNYIIDASNGIDIIKYSDIIWIYPFKLRYWGLTTTQSLIIVTENKKKHKIVTISAFSNKAKEEYEKVFEYILSKSPNALVGFNKENKEAIKNKN